MIITVVPSQLAIVLPDYTLSYHLGPQSRSFLETANTSGFLVGFRIYTYSYHVLLSLNPYASQTIRKVIGLHWPSPLVRILKWGDKKGNKRVKCAH